MGKVDGKIILDVGGLEDNFGEVDMAIATIGKEDKIILLQMDGIITKEEFLKMIELGKKGCVEIYEKQKQALRERYKRGEISDEEQ